MSAEQKAGKFYCYLIKARDVHTNDVLAAQGLESGEYLCSDGKTRFMFVAPNYDFVAYLQRSKSELQADFEVFVQEDNKRPHRWPFDAAKRQHKPRVKAA